MNNNNPGTYRVLVFAAYGYFILLGGIWFLTALLKGGHFNITAFAIMVIFSAQAWFKNHWANLIIGVLSLFFSFYFLMEVLNSFNLLSKDSDFNVIAKVMTAMAAVCIAMSVILIFSFSKMQKEQ